MTWSGVDLFFVLSGFLITGILLDRKDSPHRLKHFYIRRGLRILPLYWGLMLTILALRLLVHLHVFGVFMINLLFLQNYAGLAWVLGLCRNPSVFGIPTHSAAFGDFMCHVGITWSLCVEEQFYLLWPLVVGLAPNERTLRRWCRNGILFTLALRIVLYIKLPAYILATHFLYGTTYTRIDSLLVGAWLILWLRQAEMTRSELLRRGWLSLSASATAIAVLMAAWGRHYLFNELNPIFQTVGYTIVALGAAGILLLAIGSEGRLKRVLTNKHLQYVGKISFGFYLLHDLPEPGLDRFASFYLQAHHLRWTIFVAALIWSFGAAALSYRFLEKPFLNLKAVWAPEMHKVRRPHLVTSAPIPSQGTSPSNPAIIFSRSA